MSSLVKANMKQALGVALLLAILISAPAWSDDEDEGPVFYGNVQKTNLDIDATTGSVLQAGVNEQELIIEWDRWRNKFERAVWVKMNSKLCGGIFIPIGSFGIPLGEGGGYDFKRGTKCTWYCEITNDRRVRNVRLKASSGDPTFDDLILSCVQALDGKKVCAFPLRSRRAIVSEGATMKIGLPVCEKGVFNDHEAVPMSAAEMR